MSVLFPARSIAIELLLCTDQSRIREFNLWYDKVHVQELRGSPGVVDVYRYLDVQPDFGDLGARIMAPSGSPARYLTIYRINAVDPWAVMEQVREDEARRAAEGKLLDCMQSVETSVWDFIACRHSILPPVRSDYRLPDGMPEAILLLFGGADPEHLVEHDDWWLYTHAHDLLETPGMRQCQRYRTLNPQPVDDEANVLNIYEFEVDDPAAAVQHILEDDLNVRRPQGRFSPFSKAVKSGASGVYRHWDPM
ncbi:MAG: hypothetical protein M1274_01565 [Actinobacteria bacterium]|nr:hypothetical protein [Actinomycetota bacterium]